MIQRVQTLFLLAVTILMIVFLFVPVWKKENQQSALPATASSDKVVLNAFKATHILAIGPKEQVVVNKVAESSTVYIGALAILSALTALFSIFQFKKRLLQIKLGFLNSILLSGVLGSIFLGIKSGNTLMTEAGAEDFLVGFYLPIIALLFNLIANRFIKKDEELVRSVDRIR